MHAGSLSVSISANRQLDDPEGQDGMPCVVQVIAPRFLDEECLRAAAIIDRDLKRYAS